MGGQESSTTNRVTCRLGYFLLGGLKVFRLLLDVGDMLFNKPSFQIERFSSNVLAKH